MLGRVKSINADRWGGKVGEVKINLDRENFLRLRPLLDPDLENDENIDENIITITTMQVFEIYKDLQVDDPVLVRQFPSLKDAKAAGHYDVYPILKVYNWDEEDYLRPWLPLRLSEYDGPPSTPSSPSPPPAAKSQSHTEPRFLSGRVVAKHRDSIKVDYMDLEGRIANLAYPAFRSGSPISLSDLVKVGDAVLGQPEAHHNHLTIARILSEREESTLVSRGMIFPDVPPELYHHGYYG